MTLAKWKEKQC